MSTLTKQPTKEQAQIDYKDKEFREVYSTWGRGVNINVLTPERNSGFTHLFCGNVVDKQYKFLLLAEDEERPTEGNYDLITTRGNDVISFLSNKLEEHIKWLRKGNGTAEQRERFGFK